MSSADEFFSSASKMKWAAKQLEWQAREDERRQRWEENEIEERRRRMKEKLAVASLQQKMEGKNSGLLFATAEEAQMLRRR
jgi:hypothetical protein